MNHQLIRETAQDAPSILFCARDENLEPGVTYGPVIRDIYILECCTSGYGAVVINRKEFPVGPGDCYVLLPGDVVIHKTAEVNPRSGVWCAVNGLQVGKALSLAGITSENPFVRPELFGEILALVEEAMAMKKDPDPGVEFRRLACLYRILGILLRDSTESDRDSVIQKAVGMMEARYHESLSVEEIAASVGLERSYFSTFFKERTGYSPHRYLNRLRIQKACMLMEGNRASVADAAEYVGLDPQNFARLFKKEMGVTPLKYKKNG